MLKMGIIGAGVMGEMHARVLAEYENADLVAVCDLNRERAESLAERYRIPQVYVDHREMLEKTKLDAVSVATPDNRHRAPVVDAVQSGVHVLLEKPLSVTLDDGIAIVEAVRKSGKRLMVNYGNRHRPIVAQIRDALSSGKVGRPEYFYIRTRPKLSKTLVMPWAADTNPTMYLLSHLVDIVRWLAQDEVRTVYAVSGWGALANRGVQTPDTTVCLLTFSNGAHATCEGSWILPDSHQPSMDLKLEILGDSGIVESDWGHQGLNVYGKEAETLPWDWEVKDYSGKTRGWWITSVRYFVDTILAGGHPLPDETDGLAVNRVLLAIIKSYSTGRTVTL